MHADFIEGLLNKAFQPVIQEGGKENAGRIQRNAMKWNL